MPFFHDQGRDGLRRHYLEAWRKHRAGMPLEPLEHQLVTVIEQHPEYHPLLEADPQAVGRDYTPESGQSNPFLHLGLHLAIREQVATDRPPGIAAAHRALAQRCGDVHEAEHRMLERLGEALWYGQRTGRPPDESAYLESVRQLLGPGK
ncbi:MAG: DUF1841 family protein [Steroidobacteraceae bacterium]|nr:DUF1841 family protein [Steroidobacteraceae bacterium]